MKIFEHSHVFKKPLNDNHPIPIPENAVSIEINEIEYDDKCDKESIETSMNLWHKEDRSKPIPIKIIKKGSTIDILKELGGRKLDYITISACPCKDKDPEPGWSVEVFYTVNSPS